MQLLILPFMYDSPDSLAQRKFIIFHHQVTSAQRLTDEKIFVGLCSIKSFIFEIRVNFFSGWKINQMKEIIQNDRNLLRLILKFWFEWIIVSSFWKSFWKHFYGLPATHSPFIIAFRGLFQRVKKGVEIGDEQLGGRARMKKMFRWVSELTTYDWMGQQFNHRLAISKHLKAIHCFTSH